MPVHSWIINDRPWPGYVFFPGRAVSTCFFSKDSVRQTNHGLVTLPGLLHQHHLAVLQVPDARGPVGTLRAEVPGRRVGPRGPGEPDAGHGSGLA